MWISLSSVLLDCLNMYLQYVLGRSRISYTLKKHVEYFLVDLIIANLIDNQASIVLVTQI